MVSLNYLITEPHPSVPRGRSAYVYAGRGGAGNYQRYKSEDLTVGHEATGPASRTTLSPPPSTQKFTSGRGGMGNTFCRSDSQRAIFSFDEELERDQKLMDARSKAPVYHIGRGGAGNAVDDLKPSGDRHNSSASISSKSSNGSSVSNKARRSLGGAFRSLSRTWSRESRD